MPERISIRAARPDEGERLRQIAIEAKGHWGYDRDWVRAWAATGDFSPAGLIKYYNLRRPIYKNTARYGHVGVDRPECTWEKLEKVEVLRKAAGLKVDSDRKTAKK